MQLYNSLTKRTEEFRPPPQGPIIMYVCGLTPYDHAHIGHTRTYVAFDTIKRYWQAQGHAVYHVQNITDVDDKILARCRETGVEPKKLTENFHAEALEHFDRLRIVRADVYPKVTEHIPDIIGLIAKLVEQGCAYETKTGVYYEVRRFENYGRLSGQKQEEIRAGARVEVDETKRAPEDFALWKKTSGELLEFDSPWGSGRPGWHIECSAMAMRYAKRTLDIHGGARDLIFPHHENEIAQSEPLQAPFCRYWMHTGFLTVGGEKMSKSLGNFIRVADAVEKFSANAIRLFFLQAHYRSPVDYNEEALHAAEESVERIFNTLGLLREEKTQKADRSDADFRKAANECIRQFYAHMDNDFDTPNALAALFGLLRTINQHLGQPAVDRETLTEAERAIGKMLEIFGLEEERRGIDEKLEPLNTLLKSLGGTAQPSAAKALAAIMEIRESCRKQKDYKKSDDIRKKLKELGIALEDKDSGGVRWKPI